MRELLQGLLDLVNPPLCAACGASTQGAAPLCARCEGALPLLTRADNQPSPRFLDGCFASVAFAGDAEDWIHRFKYPGPGLSDLDPVAPSVARWLIRRAAELVPDDRFDLVVPIPLHPRRLRSRGFNPAGILGRALAREHHLSFDPVALLRERDTPSQTGLSRRERLRNVRGAFRANPRRRIPASLWLVDDVVTTGSTLGEAARTLRRAGARRIVGVCLARTPRPGA